MYKVDISSLKTILGCLDEDSYLAQVQEKVIAIMEQLENNSYTLYSQDFGNSTWEHECSLLGVPKEAMEVKIGFLVKGVKIDTYDMAKRFCLDNTLIQNYPDGRYCYDHPDNGINDINIAHIEGNRLVYDVNPIFSIGETFSLPYVEYEKDGVAQKTITETYTITGYDLSGCHSDCLVYLGDEGSAWITEDALMEQKAIAKIGDKFEIHFDYYETGELTEHTITRIDFTKTESDEVLYCDDNAQVYIAESEMLRYKASTHFTIVDQKQYCVVSGRYFPDDEDVERFLNEGDACFAGSGEFFIHKEDIGGFYRELDFDVEFLARSAFCVQAIPIGKDSIDFLVHADVFDAIADNKITTTQQLEKLVSLVNDSPTLEQGMSVGQLIAQLQKLDPDKLVTIVVGDEDKNIVDTRHFELHATDDGVEYVEFFVKASLSTATAPLDQSTMLPYQYNGECMDLYTLQAKLAEEGYPCADCDEMEFSEYIWARQNQNQVYFNDPLPMPSKIVGLLERYELSYRNGEIEKTVYATSESQAIEFACEYNHHIEYWQIAD